MTRMKDSGIEWIGEVPEDWGIKPIKHIFGAIGSGTTPDSSKVEYYDGNINWLQSGDLYKKDYVYAVSKTITDLGYRSSASLRIYQAPFLAIAMYGASIGNLAISKIDACVNQAVAVLKGEENIVRFAKLALEISKTELIFAAQGGTQPNINQVLIKNWVIPFPSEIEIKKIADFLDKKVAQLDSVKSLLEEQVKTLEDYRQSLIYETVTKGLDKTVPLKDSGVDWIGQIPEGWEVKKHKYIMSKTKTLCSHYSGQKILSLTRQGIISRDIESGKGKMPASFDGYQFLTRGDLLLCLFDIDVTPRCVGVVESDGLTSPAYSRFKVSEDSSVYYYYYLFLSMDDDKVLLHLAKNLRNSLTEDDFGDIETIVPSYKEQVIIANYLNKKTLLIDKLIKLKKEQIENINKQRQTLIYDYVTGKRRI